MGSGLKEVRLTAPPKPAHAFSISYTCCNMEVEMFQRYARPQSSLANPRLEATGIAWVDRYEARRNLAPVPGYLWAKRALDIVLVLCVLPPALLVLFMCAAAVKLESPGGPITFAQLRTGKGGHRFRMLKFRTMVPNAEELKKELAHLNELQWPDFKITNDPRITRVGRILRKTSLDELPQIFNVIGGDMSLVGPRPTSFAADTYQLWQTARLDVQPGITGIWQVVGRAETEFTDRLRLDIAYIERRCIKLDIEILVRTVLAVFAARGAR